VGRDRKNGESMGIYWEYHIHAVVFTPALLFPPIFYPLLRGRIFLDPIPPLFLYIKHIFSLNKQFSIDSFLDLEGLH